MTRVLSALALVGALSLVACGPAPVTQTCDSTTCSGCCGSDGICKPGVDVNACGIAGGLCQDCSSSGQCSFGGLCTVRPPDDAGTGGGSGGGAGGGTAGGAGGGTAGGAGGGVAGGAGGGGGTTPVGNTCASAVDVVLANGVGAAVGDRTGATGDATGSCGGGTSADVVYSFTTTTVGTLTVDLRPRDASQKLVAYLRTACDQAATEVPAACVQAQTTGAVMLVMRALPAGTYYLWVDGADANVGAFDLSLTHGADRGEVCAAPLTLAFQNGEANAVGSTAGAVHDSTGTCGGLGADVVYRMDVTTLSNLDVSLSTLSTAVRPTVYLRGATCTGGELACNAATVNGGTGTLRIGNLAPGAYFVWVDSANANAGDYRLSARLSAPTPGDTCAAPTPLAFSLGSDGGTAAATGDTALAFPDSTGTCATGTGGDVVYSFTTGNTLDLRATATPTTATYRPAMYLRAATCTGAERVCSAATAAGGTSSLALGSLAPGNYFLWVDGVSNTSGGFNLAASLTQPVAGDTCSAPLPLTFSNGPAGGTATASGDTAALFQDTNGTCAGGTAGDTVYTFTTNTVLDFRVSVATTSTTYRPVVYLRNTSCLGTERGCNVATAAGGTANLSLPSLPAGTYYLWVDGTTGTAGPFALSADLTTPRLGESCANAEPLVFTGGAAAATGDTSLNFNDGAGTCATGTAGDTIYTFTTTQTLDFTASVATTSTTFRPAVYLRQASCTGADQGCAIATAAGGTAALTVNGLTPGTYFLWVDGVTNTSGPFSLTAALATAPAEEVRPTALVDVAVPGPMVVGFDVVDRYGNVMTTDNGTTFTVTVTGSAVIASASTGTIVSGAGTNSAVVRVAGGSVRLSVTDTVSEAVTFAAIDTQPNGLRYPGATYTQTSAVANLVCTGGVVNVPMNIPARATGNGTLTVFGRGDFSSGASEFVTIYAETTAGTNYGTAFSTGSTQCGATYSQAVKTMLQADLNGFLADGVLTIAVQTSAAVNCICGANNNVYVSLTFPTSLTANFL